MLFRGYMATSSSSLLAVMNMIFNVPSILLPPALASASIRSDSKEICRPTRTSAPIYGITSVESNKPIQFESTSVRIGHQKMQLNDSSRNPLATLYTQAQSPSTLNMTSINHRSASRSSSTYSQLLKILTPHLTQYIFTS